MSNVILLSEEQICFICLEPCETKNKCGCNSFIHKEPCQKELQEKWDKDVCPYCKKDKYSKIKKIYNKFFSYPIVKVIIYAIILPFIAGFIHFFVFYKKTVINEEEIFNIWTIGMVILIFSALGLYILGSLCVNFCYCLNPPSNLSDDEIIV